MIDKIISGGQTGADQGGLRAGKRCGIPTGGMAPKGFLTETGPNPLLGSVYGLVESKSDKYPPRTKQNVKDSDGTIRFAVDFATAGEVLTLRLARECKRSHIDVDILDPIAHEVVAQWIRDNGVRVLNVAGNREKTHSGIADFVEDYLCKVIQLLMDKQPT